MIGVYRKIVEVLNQRERRRFFLLMGLVVVMSFFETVGVASILPFLHVVTTPDVVTSNAILSWVYERLGFETVRDFTIFLGLCVLALQIVGLVVRGFTLFALNRFSVMRSFSLSSRLLASYLRQPYTWFLSRHSSDLSKSVLSEVDLAVRNCILPAMRLMSSLMMVLFIGILLVVMEPMIALTMAIVLGGFYALLFLFLRNPLIRIGRKRIEANRARFHAVQEATGGLKELKVMGLEGSFLGRFNTAAYRLARYQSIGLLIPQIPRIVLEGLAFGSVVAIVLVILSRGDGDASAILPTLGLIGAAGIRLLPALQQVYSQVATIRFNLPALERLHSEVLALDHAVPPPAPGARTAAPIALRERLELQDVSFFYPGSGQPSLDGLSLSLKANTTVAFVGGTGAGKTTTIDLILGLLTPDSGCLRVDDTVLTPDNIRGWQRRLGYVPQHIFLSDQSVAENIAFGLPKDRIDQAAVERAARIANLHDFVVNELPEGYETPVGERGVRLSGGQRQRIGIARALYHDPDVLILDEATSALDNLTERAVMEAVQRIGGTKTVILIAHRLSTVRHCDCIFLMQRGRVTAQGTYDELVASNSLFRDMSAAS